MASEEQQETIEEKKASNEAIDLQAIHNPITAENQKGQMEIKSDILDGNIVNKEGDLIKKETEVPFKLGIFAEPNQIITGKPESLDNCTEILEGELKEQEVLRHEEAPSPLELPTAQEQQEKVNGETENELYSTEFTEQLSPELVSKGNGIPANVTNTFSEDVQEKIDTEEVTNEDAHQNQISEKDETEKDPIESNSMVALSEKDSQKEVELPVGNASQNPEEDVAEEVGIPTSTTPLAAEEILEEAKGENDALEEVQQEQIHQIEISEKDETEKDPIESNSMVALSEKDSQKEVELPVGNASQNPEEDVAEEVGIPTSTTPLAAEEILEEAKGENDALEEVQQEQIHQIEISEKDETEKDPIESNSMVALSEKDSQKEVELPIGNASQNPEEDVIEEVGIATSTTPLVAEEILEEAKGENDALEEVQKEQIHQIETAKETMAEEKECPDETEDQNRDISVIVTSEETIPEEICEEVKQTEDPTLYDQPITIEETSKSDEGSEHISEKVEENDVAATTPLISEEAGESADIKEDTKEEADQDQIFKEDETGEDASQSTSVVLPEKYCENETEKTIENARGNPEEEQVTKEAESVSSVTPPASEEVLEEAKEKIDAVEEVQNEQAAEENWAEEKERKPAEAEVQNRDVSEVVVSEETIPVKANPEQETPEMISEEVKPSDDTIAMAEKDEMRQNDNKENSAYMDLTSSHQTIANEETSKTDEGSEHISENSTLEAVTTRDITPEIEIKDAEIEAPTSETDNRDIEKMVNEDEAKSCEEVKPSESTDAPMKIEEETPNDFEEEKSEGDNKRKDKETDDEQEVNSCFATEEQLDESKAPPSEEEVSAEKDTIETKPIKETEGDEQNVAQNEITLDSKETCSNNEVVNYDEKAGEAMEMHIAEEHNANNDINGDELREGNGKNDEASNGNAEEISEPAEPINNIFPEEEEEVTKEVESASSVTPPVSEEVLEEAKEKIDVVEEAQNEQAAEENWAEEKERKPAEADVQNRDVSEVVVSEETIPEEASPEQETPEMISEEVKPSDDIIAMAEKDETRQNDNEENSTHKDLTSSHQTIANGENSKTDEDSEHVSEKSTLETVTTGDITPEIEIKDAETEALTGETDNRDIEKMENEEEAKSPEEIIPSESTDAPMEIEEETLNDFEEEKSEGNNEWKNKETEDEQEVKSSIATEEQLDESKAPPSEEEVSAERDTIETKPIKEIEGDEQNVAQNETALDSKETFSKDEEVVNFDEKPREAMEMHVAEEHNAYNDINGDELGEGNGKDDEADKGNVEEISEPAEPINNTEASIDAEIPREEITLQSDNAVSAQLTEGEEAVQETPCESTTLSEMERENIGYKALDSETDNMVVENSQEDDPNELPDKADKDVSTSEDQIEEDGKVDRNEHEEVEQKIEVEEKTEENLLDNIEHETAPSIQNEENPSEKDDNIKNEITDENQSSIDDDKVDTERLEPGTESYLHVKSITPPISQEDSTGNSVAEGNSDDVVLQNSNELEPEMESTSEIHSNEEDAIIKEQCVQDEPKSSDIEGSTEVTEAPEEDEQNRTSERSYKQDQLVPEKETEQQDGLKISSSDNEFETEKLEVGDGSSHGEEKASVILQNDDELDLKLKSEEKIEVETLSNEEITQRVEEVDEPFITHNKEELPEAESTIECQETSNEPSISTIQPDQQSEESDAKPTEPNQATDDTSVEEGSETSTTLISSTEQIDERSIAKDEGDKMQEEIIDVGTPKEETEGESTEKQIEEIPQIINPSEVPEVDLSQSETVAPETENLEVVSDEKIGDESKSADTDSKSVELENTTNKLTELKESSIEPSNTREAQIDQTEIIAEQDQLSQVSDVKPTELDRATDEISAQANSEVNATLSASVEQIEDQGSVAQEESVILQEEDLKMPKEDAEMIAAAANEKHTEEEIPQIVHPSEITEEQLAVSETVSPEAEHSEIVSNEKFEDESKLTETDLKSAQMESTPDELIEEKWNANISSSERSEESEVLLQNTGEQVQGEKTDAEMPKEEICQAIEAAEEPCDKHIEGEILKTADSEICDAAEESKSIFEKEVGPQKFETQTESPEQEKATQESALVEEKSDATAILVPSEEQIEEKENAINESGALPHSTTESVIVPEEKISGVETNEEPSDMVIAGEIPQIVPTSEITEKQLVESEIVGPDAKHLEIVSNEKFGDENKLSETDLTSDQMENMLNELVKEKSIADLSASVEQISERSEESEGLLQNTGEQVQGEKPDAEMPKEEIGQAIEAAEAPCDKHIEGEICKTRDLEIFDAAEESKAVLTEKEVDPQKFGTEAESPELEKVTEESTSVEEKSDASAIFVPGEGQIEEIEITNKESSGVPQSTTELVIVSEEKNSQGIETDDEPSDKDISVESSKIANPEIHDVAVQTKIVSNDEEVDSAKLGTEIESTELEKATEESTSVEEKSDAGADLVPSEGQIEEIEISNKASSVAPQNTIELVTVPEEKVSQGIETNEEPSDKHIVGEFHEKDISIDNFQASEEIHLVLEDKVDQGQTIASPVEQSDSKNVGTEMESAFLEKTNGDIDVKANLEKTTVTSFVEEEGAVINQTDNGSETLPVVEQTHEEKTKLIDEKIVPAETANSTETEELQLREEALDTVVTEPENQTKDEDLIRTETKEEISEIEKVGQEKDIPTEFLKAAEQKVVVDETDEDTEETVPNFSEQNKEVEEEADRSEGPEHRDFASIVSSFLISKVLSEENPRTDGGTKQNNDASFIPKALDEETIQEITTDKKEPEPADEEISYVTSLREEEKPEILEREEKNGEKKTEEDGEGDGVEQDYLPVSRFLMDKILRQEENKNLGEEKAIEETDKQLVRDDGIRVEEKIEENSNPVMAPEQKGETPSSFAEVARDFEEETLIKKVDDTFVGDGGISIEEKTEEITSVVAFPKQEGEGSHSSIEVARDFEEEKPADDAPKSEEDKNKTVVSDVGILSVVKNEEGNRSVVVVPEQEDEKSISPIEAVRDFEKEDKSIEQKNEALVTNEGISIIEKIEYNTGEEMRDFDNAVKPAEIKDESLVSVDGACTLKRIEEENSKVALHEQEGETEPSLVEEVEDKANREQNKDLEEVLVNPREFSEPEKIIDENKSVVMHKEEEHKTEVIADEETPKDVKDVEENYVLVEREVDQFEESKEILMQVSDATIPNLEKKQNNLSTEIQDAERNLVQQVELAENGMKNSSVSFKEIEENLPDTPKVPTAGVETEAILQEPLEKQRDLEATEIRKELVCNETDSRGEEQAKEVTGTVVERIQNKNQELTEIEAPKIEKKSEEVKDEEHREEDEEEKHQDETEIIGRDLTVKAEARETEMKSAQKKSHNILSGVGSKVKHSLAKVKKAITGKSKNVSPSAK